MPTLQWTNTAREEYRNILRSVYESSVVDEETITVISVVDTRSSHPLN